MIIVEDIKTGKKEQFVILDAFISLGHVRAGRISRTFDFENVLRFYAKIEKQLKRYSEKYHDAYRYRLIDLPFGTLPIVGMLYQNALETSSWLVDYFIAHPLTRIKRKTLSRGQIRDNIESVYKWSMWPPFSARLYNSQDLRMNITTKDGWGCILDRDSLENCLMDKRRDKVRSYIVSRLPVFIDLNEPDELDVLLRWLISIKDSGLPQPRLIVKVNSHSRWGDSLTKLLDIPNCMISTAGATIQSLAVLIKAAMVKFKDRWSTRFVYASDYPNVNEGDEVSEILSLLLSKSLSAEPRELQRILAGNLMSLLPPRPPFLNYIDNDVSVIAESRLGSVALNEMNRVLQLLAAKGGHGVISVDHMVSEGGGKIDSNSFIMTIREGRTRSATNLGVHIERDGTFRIAGWRNSFNEMLLVRNGGLCATLIKSATQSGAIMLSSPTHVSQFVRDLLKGLRVSETSQIIASLQFNVKYGVLKLGTISMHPDDIEAIRLENDHVIMLEPSTQNWGVAKVISNPLCPSKSVIMSREEAEFLGFRQPAFVDIVSFRDQVVDLEDAVFTFGIDDNGNEVETFSFIVIHREKIEDIIRSHLFGRGFKFWLKHETGKLMFQLTCTNPELEAGQLAKVKSGKIALRPSRVFEEYNIVVALAVSQDVHDIQLTSRFYLSGALSEVISSSPKMMQFISKLRDVESRVNVSRLASLIVLNLVAPNPNECEFVLCSKQMKQNAPESTGILTPIQDNLIGNLSDIIINSSLVDEEGIDHVFQLISQNLKLNQDIPTLVLLFTDLPLSKIGGLIKKQRIDEIGKKSIISIFWMGSTETDENLDTSMQLQLIPTEEFSAHIFGGYLLSVLGDLIKLGKSLKSV